MLKRIVETIINTTSLELKRKDTLFLTKKFVGQASIPKKNGTIQRINIKNNFLEGLIGKQTNIL